MPGMVLGGRYQVQDKIGTGGMATVYRGLDEVLGRTVAIKTMLPQYATDPSFAARFKQEAQAAAALQSPYIVSVYDWGKDADTYYIVMEYLRGTDLKSGIRKHGALECRKVAQIGSQIAQALSVAHKHDIIHRDIKPQNIMVQPDGNIKVMDFGIARAKNSHLTQDNSVLGTAHYVSPEQTQGKELGPTTDIYSLGIVMYEAATGQVPFRGDDAISVALKQVNEQPKPPSQLNPAVDPSLEAIILKCMQKDPAARFQTADELFHTLRDYLAGRVQAVNNATAMLAAQATSKIERGAGVIPATGGTAALPHVDRTNRYRGKVATESPAPDDGGKGSGRGKTVGIVIGGLVVLAIIVAAVVAVLGSGTATKRVPNLLEASQEDAIQMLTEAGFEIGEVSEDYSSTIKEGLVCEQDPEANTMMPEGTKVNITLSLGEEPAEETTVPDLKGLTAAEATAKLKEHNLVGEVGDDQESDEVESGRVCSQDTAPDTKVPVGTTVIFHISTGAGEVTVPAVTGDTLEDAQARLTDEKYGFTVNVTYEYSSTVDYGRVISVDPGEGEVVKKGSSVTLVVSSGPETVSIPSVVGKTYYEAASALQSAGFKVALANGSSASGVVTYQSKTGSAVVGTTIYLTTQTQSSGGGDSQGGGGDSQGGDTSGGGTDGGDASTTE